MSIRIAGDLVIMAEVEERERCAQIVREEWHRAVDEFGLRPGTPTEVVTARCLERILCGDAALAQDIRR